jgi:alcohol dehydrogenase (cytochrome c)
MNFPHTMRSLMKTSALLLLAAAATFTTHAQGPGLDPSTLLKPPSDTWPTHNGDYSGRRHSPLTQINQLNVKSLALAWAFQSNQPAAIKASPLMVDGIMYLTVPDNVWAVDARTGHMLWRYTYPPNKGDHIGQRGVAMWHNYIYMLAPDDHLVCLNAKDGTVRWIVSVADSSKGYWTTMAPLVIRNHVIVGVSGDMDNLPGILRSIDPETGKIQWTFYSTPPAGTPNTSTGGPFWVTGTYDPDLNLTYWGTGNPTPVLQGSTRPGDDLYTCSIIALNPDTGELKWAFQPSPHDTHDWDAVETPILIDGTVDGKPRKLLAQASRNGYFFVLDRTNGKDIVTTPFGPVNWAIGIDAKGQPIPNPDKEPKQDGRIIAPDEGGMNNFRSSSFDPKTGLFIVDAHPSWSLYFTKPDDGAYGWAGADYGLWGKAVLEAIDYHTGKIKWSHDFHDNGAGPGVLTTESGLVFTGDPHGNVLAMRTADGKILWHAGMGNTMVSSPESYQLDGRQYVITSSGGVVFAWALPSTE